MILSDDPDWAFCEASLGAVSRTFSRPISMLDGRLRVSVTCAYLLCRIVDTIEDDPHLSLPSRANLYKAFVGALEGDMGLGEWSRMIKPLLGTAAELALAQNLDRVLRTLGRVPLEMQRACRCWIGEMCRGMAIYSHRPIGEDGLNALIDLSDLCRYCYFVAGTVGHLLTDLFFLEHPLAFSTQKRMVLRQHAESFGVGLQLVNILKDVTDDWKRERLFIPRTMLMGGPASSLFEPGRRNEAHRAVAPIFDKAFACLDEALAYTLAVPPSLRSIRLFLLLPLWMAIRTLKHEQGNDGMFDPAVRIVITRSAVEELIQSCIRSCDDQDALRRMYAAMRNG